MGASQHPKHRSDLSSSLSTTMDKENSEDLPSVQLDDVPSVASPKVSSMDASEGSSKPAAEQVSRWRGGSRRRCGLVPSVACRITEWTDRMSGVASMSEADGREAAEPEGGGADRLAGGRRPRPPKQHHCNLSPLPVLLHCSRQQTRGRQRRASRTGWCPSASGGPTMRAAWPAPPRPSEMRRASTKSRPSTPLKVPKKLYCCY